MKYTPPLQNIPADIVCLDDYQRYAKDFLAHDIYEYIAAGAADEYTLNRNRSAFANIELKPRLLRSFSTASTQTTLLGHDLAHPFLLAPLGYQQLCHASGELATAIAADAMDTAMIVSTLATASLEDIAAQTDAPKWFQLYFQPQRRDTSALLARVEAAGYSAIVVTVDAPLSGLRNRAQRAGFQIPPEIEAVNISPSQGTPAPTLKGQNSILQQLMAPAPQWQDLAWLKKQTTLPIIIKGVINPDDAVQLADMGMDAIIVSNHGGRCLDGLPASIDALPAIRDALGADFPILLDSGIRRGSDIIKAIALGANAVLIGRPQAFALAVAGALGVAHMLRLLKEELEITMALCGCPHIADINRDCIFTPR
ncbi:isopentenyl diphosphate isomerase/L-lactate dehydrogenase-like FMN-dependent dehydrogenase [Zhongshania antarctica]|jgi:isopentenyl diphosphate isomerase/L-lactate dehydrogenase-like FMN-dependent dehydrogenase|uniref:Isopentenyl diphosphate isomerase/L-lactate dehydrogenase-like FMN-dependent dehydrogenase n=1 Tax=Zhongshania antarctica TaxID=641702 RepID=A0A840R000_9GAMM|nr:alpha-hydroxy acid oxidase [Zhongshania antarctica]MBB5186389.1 isopentenyl diphosphate isomerase/L-lactate dehydrogenase-like FMN-dependent dehydrogenase [Zhongshania antarctica]